MAAMERLSAMQMVAANSGARGAMLRARGVEQVRLPDAMSEAVLALSAASGRAAEMAQRRALVASASGAAARSPIP
jgi:hypothetical protein